jgi:hypothetical protein
MRQAKVANANSNLQQPYHAATAVSSCCILQNCSYIIQCNFVSTAAVLLAVYDALQQQHLDWTQN